MKCKLRKILLIICDMDADMIRNALCVLSENIALSQTVVLTTEKIKKDLSDNVITVHSLPEEAKDEYILKTIREFTDQYDVELICCVAGESELSIIVANVMSLSARYLDSLCHASGNPVKITNILFTRLCYLYQDKFNHLPATYADSVELANLRVSRHADAPEVFLSTDPGKCMIGDCELPFTADEFILFWLLAMRCKNEIIPIQGEAELLDEYHAFIDSTLSTVMPEICGIRESLLKKTEADILRLVDSMTEKIKADLAFANGRDFSLPTWDHNIYGISFPPENIVCPRNY